MGKKSITTWIQALIAIAAFVLIAYTNLSPMFVVIGSGLIGILLSTVKVGAKQWF